MPCASKGGDLALSSWRMLRETGGAHGEARVTFGVRGKTGYDQNSRLTSAATRAANTQKNTRRFYADDERDEY